MENLLAGMELLARWDVFLALLVGSVGGVIIGAIPGVGPAVAIAILRNISTQIAAITATMPINIPLGMWVAYGGKDASRADLIAFTDGLLISIAPTLVFIVSCMWLLRAGWGIMPTVAASYVVWAGLLALAFVGQALISR